MASRHTEVNLAGQSWRMPASYAAALLIARQVGDPLKATLELSRGAFPWSTEDVISIVHIGTQAAGCPLSRAQVAEYVHEAGPIHFVGVVAEYIKELVSGSAEKPSQGQHSAKKE